MTENGAGFTGAVGAAYPSIQGGQVEAKQGVGV